MGPVNPFLSQQQRSVRNMLSGYVEQAHLNAFEFENQRRTFTSFGNYLIPIKFIVKSLGDSYQLFFIQCSTYYHFLNSY